MQLVVVVEQGGVFNENPKTRNRLMKSKLHFLRTTHEWIQRDMMGKFMQRYEDCINFHKEFPDANKDSVNIYEIPQAKKIAEYPLAKDDLDFGMWGCGGKL